MEDKRIVSAVNIVSLIMQGHVKRQEQVHLQPHSLLMCAAGFSTLSSQALPAFRDTALSHSHSPLTLVSPNANESATQGQDYTSSAWDFVLLFGMNIFFSLCEPRVPPLRPPLLRDSSSHTALG